MGLLFFRMKLVPKLILNTIRLGLSFLSGSCGMKYTVGLRSTRKLFERNEDM